ncbi:MED14-domain-containing protein [Meredithblackwellia eburnea MCA 4105]
MDSNGLVPYLNGDNNQLPSAYNSNSPSPPPPPPPPLPVQQATAGASKQHQQQKQLHKHEINLENELPNIMHDLIPLSHIVQRVVGNAYMDLNGLAEVLPGKTELDRKRAIVDYVLQTRRQLIKLLVLVRWSREADNVAKCMNIIGFLSHQNYILDQAVSQLQDIKSQLASARIRNYDLPTSLTLLSTGNYSSLPTSLTTAFSTPRQLPDHVVLETLEELDQVIRWRLAARECVPRAIRRAGWSIRDGRVIFSVEGSWEASFTYGASAEATSGAEVGAGVEGEGAEADGEERQEKADLDDDSEDSEPERSGQEDVEDDARLGVIGNGESKRKRKTKTGGGEWYLLSIKFLFRVRDSRGVWNESPLGPMKEHIVEICNRELARRRVASKDRRRERRRDKPLLRGYNFLQRLSLTYQLESIYVQALHLASTSWSGNLRVEWVSPSASSDGGSGTAAGAVKGKKVAAIAGTVGGAGKKEKEKGKERERAELRVDYWSPPPTQAQPPQLTGAGAKPGPAPSANTAKTPSASNPQPQPTGAYGRLVFSILPPSTTHQRTYDPSKVEETRLEALRSVLNSGEDLTGSFESGFGFRNDIYSSQIGGPDEDDPEEEEEEEEEPERVRVSWFAEGGEVEREKADLIALGLTTDLDLESLLLRTTALHARESTLALYNQLTKELGEEDLELLEYSQADTPINPSTPATSRTMTPVRVPQIRIHLYASHQVLATFSSLSGKLEFRSLGEQAAGREARLRSAAEKVDKDRSMAGEALLRVRASTIIDEVESRASFLGLHTVRRISIRNIDYSRFGLGTRSFLFVHLPNLPNHYLVLVLAEEGFRFALTSVREITEALQTFLTVEEVGWLDRDRKEGWEVKAGVKEAEKERPTPSGFDVSVDDLRDMFQYCVRRIGFFKIQQQLHVRGIPYQVVASSAHTGPTSAPNHAGTSMLSNVAPYLVVKSFDLLKGTSPVAHPNVAIQCFLKDDSIVSTFHVRFKDLELASPDPSQLPSTVSYDAATSIVTFSSDDVDNSVQNFLLAYSVVARSIVLARHRLSENVGVSSEGNKVISDAPVQLV